MYERPQIHYRPRDHEMFEQIKAKAEEKGCSVNEWLNRAVAASLLKGGKIVVTEKEF